MRRAIGGLMIVQLTAGACAATLGQPQQSAITVDRGIEVAVIAFMLKPNEKGVCINYAMAGNPPRYHEWLTDLRNLNAGPEKDAYLQDAARLAKGRQTSFAEPRSLDLTELRRSYPVADFAQGAQCKSVITMHRPIISGDWAYLSIHRGDPCTSAFSRASLKRLGRGWAVQHSDLTLVQMGQPECGNRGWEQPPGPSVKYIQVTE